MSERFAHVLEATKAVFLFFWWDIRTICGQTMGIWNEMSRQFIKCLHQLNKLFLMRRQDNMQPKTGYFGWDIKKISSCICGNKTRYFLMRCQDFFWAETLGIRNEMSGQFPRVWAASKPDIFNETSGPFAAKNQVFVTRFPAVLAATKPDIF